MTEEEKKELEICMDRLKEIATHEKVSLQDLIDYYEARYRADKLRILNTSDYLQTLIDNGEPEEEFRNEHLRLSGNILEAILKGSAAYHENTVALRAYKISKDLLKLFENKNFMEKKN